MEKALVFFPISCYKINATKFIKSQLFPQLCMKINHKVRIACLIWRKLINSIKKLYKYISKQQAGDLIFANILDILFKTLFCGEE